METLDKENASNVGEFLKVRILGMHQLIGL